MLVCRFWYDTLDRRSLLHTLYIDDDKLVELKGMIDRQPYRATQVENISQLETMYIGSK
jgi:hypothetical protein